MIFLFTFGYAFLSDSLKELTLKLEECRPLVKSWVAFHDALPYKREPFQLATPRTSLSQTHLVQNLQNMCAQIADMTAYIKRVNAYFAQKQHTLQAAILHKAQQARKEAGIKGIQTLCDAATERNEGCSKLLQLPTDVLPLVADYLPKWGSLIRTCRYYAKQELFSPILVIEGPGDLAKIPALPRHNISDITVRWDVAQASKADCEELCNRLKQLPYRIRRLAWDTPNEQNRTKGCAQCLPTVLTQWKQDNEIARFLMVCSINLENNTSCRDITPLLAKALSQFTELRDLDLNLNSIYYGVYGPNNALDDVITALTHLTSLQKLVMSVEANMLLKSKRFELLPIVHCTFNVAGPTGHNKINIRSLLFQSPNLEYLTLCLDVYGMNLDFGLNWINQYPRLKYLTIDCRMELDSHQLIHLTDAVCATGDTTQAVVITIPTKVKQNAGRIDAVFLSILESRMAEMSGKKPGSRYRLEYR